MSHSNFIYLYRFFERKLFCFLLLLFVANCSPAQALHKKSAVPPIHNPVLKEDFPDPTIIRVKNKYYAYATQTTVGSKMWNIQMASSTDLQHWKREGDALPQKPSWANVTQDFWAPQVLYDKALKKYVLFFSAESDDTTTGKCIGVAFADTPDGPFADKGSPLICGEGFVNIDPMAFVDVPSGRKFLYWGSGFQPIKMQEMSKDWKSFKPGSKAISIVAPGKERNYTILIEGAWMDYNKGNYYLYYSGDNCCGERANYAVMIAKAKSPFGPFHRLAETKTSGSSVILEKDSALFAPGHNSIFRDGKGNVWMAYHAIEQKKKWDQHQIRELCISPVIYKNGWPVVIKSSKSLNQ